MGMDVLADRPRSRGCYPTLWLYTGDLGARTYCRHIKSCLQGAPGSLAPIKGYTWWAESKRLYLTFLMLLANRNVKNEIGPG